MEKFRQGFDQKVVVSRSFAAPERSASLACAVAHDVTTAMLALRLGRAQYFTTPGCSKGLRFNIAFVGVLIRLCVHCYYSLFGGFTAADVLRGSGLLIVN